MITRRTRASRATLLASVPLLALVVLAAGCGTLTTPPSGSVPATTSAPTPAAATPVPTTTGGSVAPGQPACTGWPVNVATETLPASFVPVAVLRCVTGDQTIPGKGQWLTATLERADEDLAPLIAALRLPLGGITPAIPCPETAVQPPPEIVLISGNGKMIIPRFPRSSCGPVVEDVIGLLAKLPWQPVSVRLVSPVETPAASASGCTPAYTDPFAMDAPAGASPGGPVYAARPASLRICLYSATAADGAGAVGANTAQFVRGATVTGPTETALLAGLTSAPSTTPCALPNTKFAVVASAGAGSPVIYVELGGCDRVFRYESGTGGLMGISAGQASPEAVAIIESLTLPSPAPLASPQPNL